jgi:parallel beta-helix repeat protein
MAFQPINIGTVPNDGTGDPGRSGGNKINQNFGELYALQSATINAAAIGYGSGTPYEPRIQSAIDDAVLTGATRVFIPANMRPYDSTQITFSTAVQMVREGGDYSVYDVLAYGAGGLGTSIDTAACQAALNGAAVSGAIVHFPAGTFDINAVLTYGTEVQIRGVGANSILRNHTSRNVNSAIMLQPTSSTGITNITIRDLVFDQRSDILGQSPSSNCISINGLTGVTIDNVIFRHVITMAVWADSIASSGVSTTNVRISGCRIEDSLGGGISVFGQVSGWTVSHNRISNCQDDAIAFQDRVTGEMPQDIEISGNVILTCDRRNIEPSTPRGILTYGCKRVAIVGNVINKTVAGAITVIPGGSSNCSEIQITDNTIYQAGITVDSTAGVPGHGIHVLDASDVVIANNRVSGSREHGIRVHGLTDRIVVTGNHLQHNGSAGLELQDTRDFTVAGNVLTDNGTTAVNPFGIFLSASTRNVQQGTIVGNRIGNSLLDGGATTTTAIRLGQTGAFVPANIVIGHNVLIGVATVFGGVAGTNISKSRNRYTTGPSMGQGVLSSGTVTISTTEIQASDNVLLSRLANSGSSGPLAVTTITAGVSFVVQSSSNVDDGTFFWEIVH